MSDVWTPEPEGDAMSALDTIDWMAEPMTSGAVTSVDGTSISFGDHWGFGWPAEAGDLPPVGASLDLLGGFGREFYGIAINGRLIWWVTPEERERKRREWLDNHAREKRETFEKNRPLLDEQYETLPAALQARIRSLRAAGGEEWRVDQESYEMFVCTEAAKIAAHFGTVAEVERWWKLGYEEQRAEWDGFSDGHSGNTFGCACHLARSIVENPERSEAAIVTRAALSPLSGDPRYPGVSG